MVNYIITYYINLYKIQSNLDNDIVPINQYFYSCTSRNELSNDLIPNSNDLLSSKHNPNNPIYTDRDKLHNNNLAVIKLY